jgi:gliding motility-associated-like protein
MKKTTSLIGTFIFLLAFNSIMAQTVIYSEDFTSGATWTLNTVTGAEDSNPNVWYVSCQEDGQVVGTCGTACVITDNSLHVSADAAFGDNGAAYAETGSNITSTDRRAESGDISTVGQTNLTLNFDMIGNGGNALDYCELFYSNNGGATWTSLAPTLVSLCCGGVACTPGLQGLWQNNSYALPVACENIANLRISFIWKNTDDGVATDPSFAVDDIEITTPAAGPTITASFTQDVPTPICEGTMVTFTDASSASGTAINSWAWTFNGGDIPNANTQGPHAITFNTAGTYNIDLTAGDGTISNTSTVSLVVVAPANAGNNNTASLCDNATLDLTTLLSGGADGGGIWTETSGAPSGQFSGSTLDGNGLTVGNVYTFDYTVTGNAPCPDGISTFTITIIDCAAGTPPTAIFTASQLMFCAEDCITFTDNSTPGDITTWAWNFDGGAVNSALQDPGNVCFFNAGTYNVTLTVTNAIGSNTSSVTTITVIALPNVTASASTASTLCSGEETILTGGGNAINYSWDNGVNDGISFLPNFGPNNFTVTGTDANGCQNSANISINVIDCEPMVAGFSYPDNICVGSCITFTDTTSGFPQSWSWDFGPDVTPSTSIVQNPETVCFNIPGVYDIQLTVTDGVGDAFSTTNSITVIESPTILAELDTLIDLGGYAELISVSPNIGNYLWTPDTYYIECDTCSSTIASPYLDTDYIVVFTDLNGCTAQDTVKVEVTFIEGIGLPQAFSPNGDGHNDQLVVKGLGIAQMNFKIYNRYGQLIFETKDQNHGWDGSFKGKDENPGVFVWVLDYELLNGTRNIAKGTTTLIR